MIAPVVRWSFCSFFILLTVPLWAAEKRPSQPNLAKPAPTVKVPSTSTGRKKTPPSAPLDWKAGLATTKITPDTLMWMAGYAARKKPAEGTLHDLYAKALALEDEGGHRVVIVTLDLIGVLTTVRESVEKQVEEQYKLPPAALLLNASHSATGLICSRASATYTCGYLLGVVFRAQRQSLGTP